MTRISGLLRRPVFERTNGYCEYCLISELFTVKRHQVDHIYAEKHGGLTDDTNLCLCCVECNRYKGSDLASLDPATGEPEWLFHPHRARWTSHFELQNGVIVPKTANARVTVRLLRFNSPDQIEEHLWMSEMGRYP